MSQARFPSIDTHVDAMHLATRGDEIEQSFLLSHLPRVREQSAEHAAAILRVRFGKADDRVLLDGEVAASLQLSCQRCLKPVTVPLRDEFNLVVVGSESELERLSAEQDAIVADATHLDLAWLAEEQLLLATPLVVLHENLDECESRPTAVAESSSDTALTQEAQRPFAALREMMKKQ